MLDLMLCLLKVGGAPRPEAACGADCAAEEPESVFADAVAKEEQHHLERDRCLAWKQLHRASLLPERNRGRELPPPCAPAQREEMPCLGLRWSSNVVLLFILPLF